MDPDRHPLQEFAEVLLIPANDPVRSPVAVRQRTDDVEYSVGHWGDRFVILTNLEAEDFRVMTAPRRRPGDVDRARRRMSRGGASSTSNHSTAIWCCTSGATPSSACGPCSPTAPNGSSISGREPHAVEVDTNPEWTTDTFRYRYQSLTTPMTVYEEHVRTGRAHDAEADSCPRRRPVEVHGDACEWATSPDGTRVPLDLVRHVDTQVDGSAPCMVYGYGSYEESVPPWFSAPRLSLLDRGVVWALAHPRGGGELGRRWYLDGKLLNKRNTFLDTIAVAEHLIARRWVSPGRVAVRGGSAGGLLVGACMTMRPELFAAVVAEVPFVDVVSSM